MSPPKQSIAGLASVPTEAGTERPSSDAGTQAMIDERNLINEANWAFAKRIYAKPAVAEACLTLQERADADVILLLTILFFAKRGAVISLSQAAELRTLCYPWRQEVVMPLRALRVKIKSAPYPAPSETTELLRSEIKKCELFAEKTESDLVATWYHRNCDTFASRLTHDPMDQMRAIFEYLLGNPSDRIVLSAAEIVVDAALVEPQQVP